MSCRRLFAAIALLVLSLIGVPAFAQNVPLGCTPPPTAPVEDFTKPLTVTWLNARLVYYRCTSHESEIAAVIASAAVWIKDRAPAVAKPAIVLDIDETSLSNWTRMYRDNFKYVGTGDCDLKDNTKPCNDWAWQRSGMAPAIQATLALYRFARCLDAPPPDVTPPCVPMEVFFVTGRREKRQPGDTIPDPRPPRQSTLANLIAAGYTDVADDHLFLRGEYDNGVADYKSSARALIEYRFQVRIIANIGDQQSDLDGGHAERTFKLPNPFYFIP